MSPPPLQSHHHLSLLFSKYLSEKIFPSMGLEPLTPGLLAQCLNRCSTVAALNNWILKSDLLHHQKFQHQILHLIDVICKQLDVTIFSCTFDQNYNY